MDPLALAVLSATVLAGCGLFWTVVADRRRKGLQQRLKAVTVPVRDKDESPPALTLRRRISQAGPGAFYRFPGGFRQQLEAEFAAAGNRIGLSHLVAVGGLAMAAAFVLAFDVLGLNPVLALPLGGAAGLAAAVLVMRLAQARYRTRFLDAFPDALDLVCRAIKAGLPVNEAMVVAAREIANPVGSELRKTLDETQIGVDSQEALQRMADRVRVPDFRFYVVALNLQRRTGGSLAETLTNLSGVIRARRATRLKARALAAETKASATVLALLPFVVGGLMFVMNRDLMSVLLTDSRGRFMLGVALLTLAVGIFTMVLIIRRSLR